MQGFRLRGAHYLRLSDWLAGAGGIEPPNGGIKIRRRRIPLEDVDEDKVSAAFKNGVLTVTVPKSAEAKNVRRIAINRNG